ncbi:O-antigen ligase family protein [Serratia ureilytica]
MWRFARQRPAASRWAGGALLLGVAAGLTVLFTGLGLDSRAGLIGREVSNSARLTMLHDVGAMILAKPLLGWGYGGFEYSFAHFRLQEMPGEKCWKSPGIRTMKSCCGGLRAACRRWRGSLSSSSPARCC